MPSSKIDVPVFFLLLVVSICMFPMMAYSQAQPRGLDVVAAPIAGSEAVGQQYAVFIAIDRYQEWPSLKNAVSDAERLKKVLQERYYIDTTYTFYNEQATKARVMKLFEDLSSELRPQDSLLIFYAGHGVMDRLTNIGSWILYDAGTDRYDQKGWLNNPSIRNLLRNIRSKHVLLVSDSCFSGDILNVERGGQIEITEDYFRKAYSRRSRQVLTSGASEAVPDESVFTRALIRLLEENTKLYLDPLMLYNEIRLTRDLTTSPLLGTLKETDSQEGGSFLFFLKQAQPALVKILYDPNGATAGAVPVDSGLYSPGTTVQLQPHGSLLKSGYQFAGWNTKPDGTGIEYSEGSALALREENITLYARWVPVSNYRILYYSNGATSGVAPLDDKMYASGEKAVVLGPASLAKSGYEFDGWNTRADGTGISYKPADTIIITGGNILLYGQWKKVAVAVRPSTGWIDFSSVPLNTHIYIDGDFHSSIVGYQTSHFEILPAGLHRVDLFYNYRSFSETIQISDGIISKPSKSLSQLADYLEEEKNAAKEYKTKASARSGKVLFSVMGLGAAAICFIAGQSTYTSYTHSSNPTEIAAYRSQAELLSAATVASLAVGVVFAIQIPSINLPPKPQTNGMSIDDYIKDLDLTIAQIRSGL